MIESWEAACCLHPSTNGVAEIVNRRNRGDGGLRLIR
jgi:hypothetical protein